METASNLPIRPAAITDEANGWGGVRTAALFAFTPILLIVLRGATTVGIFIASFGFIGLAAIAPEAGVLLLLVLLAFDVYIEPVAGSGFFASEIMAVSLFLAMLWHFKKKAQEIRSVRLDLEIALVLLLAGLSVTVAVSRFAAAKGFLQICTFAMVYFVGRRLQVSDQLLKRILLAITLVGCLTGVYGLYQAIKGAPLLILEQALNLHVVESTVDGAAIRSYATFRYSLEYGTFLIITGSLVLARCLQEARATARLMWGLMLLFVIGGLLSSYSRAAAIGFIVSLIAQFKWAKVRMRVIVASCAVVMSLVLLSMHSERVLNQRATSIADLDSPAYVGRFAKWALGAQLVEVHPWLGVGLRNLPLHLPLTIETGEVSEIPNLENLFLTYAGEIGLPGALCLMTLLIEASIISIRTYRCCADRTCRTLGLGIAGAIVAVLVNGLTDPALVDSQNGMFVFFLVGLSVAIYEQRVVSAKGATYFQKA